MKVKASYDRMASHKQKRVFGMRQPKKYRVLDRTGANILKAFVGIDLLKDKNGGVGGNISELTETKIQAAQEEGGLPCRGERFRVRYHYENIDPPFDKIRK